NGWSLAITPLPASALIAGLRILGAEEGLPRLPDLELAIYEKARPDKAAAALIAVLLTLVQEPSRPAIRSRAIFGEGLLLAGAKRSLTEALTSVKCNKRPAPKAEVADRSRRSCSNESGPLRVIS